MSSQDGGTAGGPQPLLDLFRLKERLTRQKLDVQIALNEAALTDDQLGRNEEQMQQLKLSHEEAFASHTTSQNLVERIQLTTEALRCIFPDITEEESLDINQEAKSRRLQDLMAQQRSIISDILLLRESVAEKKEIFYDLRQRNQDYRHQNRQTMAAIKEAGQGHRTKNKQRVTKCEDELQKVLDRITVLRSVFQALIVGSGVNWAQDPELLDLVVSLSSQPQLDT